jgi:hypothetical protein
MPEPPVLSLLGTPDASPGPERIRDFLETLVAAAVDRKGLVVGEAEPGRYVLVMPPLSADAMQREINAGLDVVLARLEARWPGARVTDFGLRELYPGSRDRWLSRHGMEPLVVEGKIGVVTIFCHDWLYGIVTQVAEEHGLAVRTRMEEYLKTGLVRLAGRTAFQLDIFANVREMAASFGTIDHLITKVLVLAAVGKDTGLAAKISGGACPRCGALVVEGAPTCASCGAPAPT